MDLYRVRCGRQLQMAGADNGRGQAIRNQFRVENKCTGECVPIDGTISIMDSLASTTATAGDNVNVAGDGPQVARTGRKRVSDFFNEIYNTWNGLVLNSILRPQSERQAFYQLG
ncbi:uncharacterized protein LOC126378306 [Pectinophora gossypiella]|uniref:uncharacterized protein LOC126378306 n=1 Tax=Pectinophora gossypiella TaxID=13191 RepID=UPI00214E95A8|nr:uncharacterized protein LOC126378306 [Pectinophora gossypiella]